MADGSPALANPFSTPLSPVQVTIGGQPATVSFVGLAPGLVGILQLNLLIPQVPAGDQPLAITIGGVAANSTVLSIGAH